MALPRPNHYDMLGIPQDASREAAKKAHRNWALRLHPDKWLQILGDTALVAEYGPYLKEAFLRMQTAYETICDDEKRRQYNSNLKCVFIPETADEKKANDDFCKHWDEFKKCLEIELLNAKLMEDPTEFLTQSLKEKKALQKLQDEIAQLKEDKMRVEDKHRKMQIQVQANTIEAEKRADAYRKEVSDLTQVLATEKKLRERTEQEKKALEDQLRKQAPSPSSMPSTAQNPSSMYGGSVKIKPKGLVQIRKDYTEFQKIWNFSGISLVFNEYVHASAFYMEMNSKVDQVHFEVRIPDAKRFHYMTDVERLKNPLLYFVSMVTKIVFDRSYGYTKGEDAKIADLLKQVANHFDISGTPQIKWDSFKEVPIETAPPTTGLYEKKYK